MNKTFLTAAITFKEGIRNKVLHGIIMMGAVLFSGNVVITGMFSWEVGKVAVDMGLSVISLAGLIIIFFVGVNSLANDFERKTIYLILSRPISRVHYLLGKYFGLSALVITSSVILGLLAAISVKVSIYGAEGYMPAGFSWAKFALGICYQTLSLLIVLALSLLWGTVASNSFTALLLSIISYFVGQNLENVANIISASKLMASNAALLKTIEWLSWIFPNLAAFDLKTTAAYGLSIDGGYLALSALYGITYIAAVLLLAMIVFNRRELA